MPSVHPEPAPRFTAGLRVFRPGEGPGSSDLPALPEQVRPAGTGAGLVIAWSIFRIAVWATIAVWIHPRFLDLVGGGSIASWLLHHGWVRMLCVPPLGLLGLVSAFQSRDDPRRRAAREELADRTGSTLLEPHGIDPVYGVPDGPGLRVPLGHWSMVVTRWNHRGTVRTVASAIVETRSTFSFVARGTDREPQVMRGLQQFAMGLAVSRMRERADDSSATSATATIAYLAEPPVTTGDDVLDRAVVLRANQPDSAQAIFLASTVSSAILALDARSRRWDLTFYPAAAAGMAELRLECPGMLQDADSLRVVRVLMQAALEEMSRAGFIAG